VIDRLERNALDYLESELRLYVNSPGNHDEVARILKTLQIYKRAAAAEQPDSASGAPAAPSQRRSFEWSDDDPVEDQGGGQAE
jgi:hypothetical protein